MPHPITIPRLGWSMEEGVFTEWLKSPGDVVSAGDMLFLLEGEKAATEIESLDSGRLCVPPDAPQPGATVKVGEVIGFLLAEGETPPNTVRVNSKTPSPKALPPTHQPDTARAETLPVNTSSVQGSKWTKARAAGPAARRFARELGIDLNAVFTPDPTGRVLCEDLQRAARARDQNVAAPEKLTRQVATPRARRRARELGLDWTLITGTGRNGRICERDIVREIGLRHSLVGEPFASLSDAASALPTADSPLPLPTEPGRHVGASRLRRTIAQRMSAGIHRAVPVTLTTKVDAESLVAYRERLKVESTSGLAPSYNDILIHHAAQTLRELPDLNACWYREGIHSYDAVNIATAVDTPDGLLAPVVRDADRLTLNEIAYRTRQLVASARSGQLTQNQLSGGTFTISSLGMFGIDSFTPILNLPQAAILGVGRIVEEAVVRDQQLLPGKTMTLSLTFDHRVVDGAPAARWLQRLCERIQSHVG
ncbi:MAG: dihydrolipoamide acetyltransferase family protein [Pirellula sp.]|jgi:pyruvate dehydrogenase E2 component (dihydrolipoamide acetyltransferase)